MQLGECCKKSNALREQKSGIFGQARDRVAKCPIRKKGKLTAETAVLECITLEFRSTTRERRR